MAMEVLNSLGEREPLSQKKIYQSARRSGASKQLAQKVTSQIMSSVYDGITTKEIFQQIQSILLKEEKKAGIRYGLKEAIKKLGPSGFPFELFVAELFTKYGYFTKSNVVIRGCCIEYEIDFIAQKERMFYLAECKYHNDNQKIDVNVALIAYASFIDLLKGSYIRSLKSKKIEARRLLVTNTKFSSKAIKYANCVGINLLGWRYPKEGGLEYYIEKEKFYPLTILPSVNSFLASIFYRAKISSIHDLAKINSRQFASQYNIPIAQLNKIINEANLLL